MTKLFLTATRLLIAGLFLVLPVFSNPSAAGRTASNQSPEKRSKETSSEVVSPQQLYASLASSVFVVETLDVNGSVVATGSAVAVTPSEVVTNRHVVEEGVSWRLRRGSKTWPATVTRLDPDHDLCQLKAASLSARPVPIRSSDDLAVGERVFAIGSPEGLELTLSEGLISGLREYQNSHLIQTSAPISPGSSGGGLFDAQGRLIGITTFFFKEGQNLNFALPGEWVETLGKRAVSSNQKVSADTPAFQAFVLMQLGFKAFSDRDYEKAADAYREALRLQPSLADAWYWLGAIEYLSAFSDINHKRLREGNEPHWQEAQERAAEDYRKALELRPDFVGAWVSLANIYTGLGRNDEAIRAYQEAIRLNPRFGLAWLYLGMTYRRVAENQKALQALQQAVLEEPDNSSAWFELGDFYKDSQQYGEASSSFEKAVQVDPGHIGAWFGLGFAYGALGDRTKVIEVYERMKKAQPKSADEFFKKFVLP